LTPKNRRKKAADQKERRLLGGVSLVYRPCAAPQSSASNKRKTHGDQTISTWAFGVSTDVV